MTSLGPWLAGTGTPSCPLRERLRGSHRISEHHQWEDLKAPSSPGFLQVPVHLEQSPHPTVYPHPYPRPRIVSQQVETFTCFTLKILSSRVQAGGGAGGRLNITDWTVSFCLQRANLINLVARSWWPKQLCLPQSLKAETFWNITFLVGWKFWKVTLPENGPIILWRKTPKCC